MTTVSPRSVVESWNVLGVIPLGYTGLGRYLRFSRSSITPAGSKTLPLNKPFPGGATFGALRQSLGSASSAKTIFADLEITLHRVSQPTDEGITDDEVVAILDSDFLSGRTCTIYTTTDGVTFTLAYTGTVIHRSGRITREAVSFRIGDRIKNDDRKICRTKHGDASDTWTGQVKPVVIGDWSGPVASFLVEAPVIFYDTPAADIGCQLGQAGDLGFADVGNLARWYDSGGGFKGHVQHDFLVGAHDLSTGVLRITGTNAADWGDSLYSYTVIGDPDAPTVSEFQYVYWQNGDVIRLEYPRGIRGWTITGATTVAETGASEAVTNPVDVAYTLIRDTVIGLGVDAADIDVASFYSVRGLLAEYKPYVRRWIHDDALTVLDVIESLGLNFNFRLWIDSGTYKLAWLGFRQSLLLAADVQIYANRNVHRFELSSDPESESCEAIRVNYRHDPRTNETTRKVDLGDVESTADELVRTIDSDWAYEDGGASAILRFAADTTLAAIVRLRLDCDLATQDETLGLGDYVKVLTGPGDPGQELEGIYQAVEIERDLQNHNLALVLASVSKSAFFGVWADEPGEDCPAEFGGGTVPADESAATVAQQKKLSFWATDGATESSEGNDLKVWR